MKQTNRRKQDIRYRKENRIKHRTLYLLINQTNNYHIIDNKEAKRKKKKIYMSNQFYASLSSPRVGRSKNSYDIYTTKPGIGPIDYSLDDKSGFAKSTSRRQTAFKAAGAQITSPRRRELPIGNHSSPLKRQQQRRKELNEDVVIKPAVGPIAMGIDTVPKEVLEKTNALAKRSSERYSPGSTVKRKGHVNRRHPSGRAYNNIGKLPESPNKINGPESPNKIHGPDKPGYVKGMNTSHGSSYSTYMARRNDGGRYFQRSDISKDPVLNCKDPEHPHPHHDVPTIEDRAVQSLHRKRNQWGAPFHKSTLDREAAVHNRHGRLKVVKDIPKELLDATNAALLDDASVDDLNNMSTGSMGATYEAKNLYNNFRGRTPEFTQKFGSKHWKSEYAAQSVAARNQLTETRQLELLSTENDVLRRSNRMLRERLQSGVRIDMFDAKGNYKRKV